MLGALALYAARKAIAREALSGWLERRGVASITEVEAFGLSGFTARMSVGDPARPDFAAARVDVRYRIKGFGVEVGAITLREPVVRASIRGSKLSVGALDPIIAEFRRRPPRPDAAKPRIVIDDGLLLLATDYGPVRLRADARVEDGKLLALAATSAPAQLKGPTFAASLGVATVRLATRSGRVAVVLDAPILEAAAGPRSVRGARLQMRVTAPYPDLVKRRGDGALTLRANLAAERLNIAGQRLDGAQLAGVFAGQAAGWIPDLVVTGAGSADLRAGSGALGSARTGAVTATASASDLRWTRQGGDRVTAGLRVSGLLRDLTAADLKLTRASGAFSGPLSASRAGLDLSLSGHAEGLGGWSGLGPPGLLDSADIAAVKRAAHSFAFAAPGVALQVADGFQVRLPQPLRITPASGGMVQVSGRAGAPVFGPRGGALRLTVSGGGLPSVEADAARLRFADGATTAQGRVRAALSIGPIVDGRFDAAGTLRIADGISFSGDRCAAVTAARLEFGENDATGLSGRLCPAGAPLLTLRDGDWQIRGRGEAIAAAVPFLQARVTEGAGSLNMGQSRGALDAGVRVTSAQVHDTAPQTRFNPLRMSGTAGLARETWTADLAFRTPAGQPVPPRSSPTMAAAGEAGWTWTRARWPSRTVVCSRRSFHRWPRRWALRRRVRRGSPGPSPGPTPAWPAAGPWPFPGWTLKVPPAGSPGCPATWFSPTWPRSPPPLARCCGPPRSTPSRP